MHIVYPKSVTGPSFYGIQTRPQLHESSSTVKCSFTEQLETVWVLIQRIHHPKFP
jgi:hypothetical protein